MFKKIKILILSVLLLCFTIYPSYAMHSSAVSGVREGLALGMQFEELLIHDFYYRVGALAKTGENPFVFYLGGKFPLTDLASKFPLSLGLGLVIHSGSNARAGGSVSFIVDNVFNVKPLFSEFGIDIANYGTVFLDFGYRLFIEALEDA